MLSTAAIGSRKKTSLWRLSLGFIVSAQFLTALGFGLVGPFMPLFIRELGGYTPQEAAFWSGIMAGANGLVMFLISPMWGTLSDWFGHKRNVLRASFATAAVMGATALLQNTGQLIASRILMGAVSGVFPAMLGLAGSIIPRARLVFAVGMVQGVSSLGMMIGPLIGGMIVDQAGYRFTFLLSGVIIALGGVLVLTMVHEAFHKKKAEAHNLKSFGGELSVLTHTPGVTPALAMVSLVQMAPNLVFPVFGLLVADIASRGNAAAAVGLVFTVMGSANTAAAFATGVLSHRLGLRWLFIIGGLTGAAGALAMTTAQSIPLILGLSVFLGLAVGMLATSASGLVGQMAPSSRQGSAFGLVQSANAIGFGFGPFLGGLIAHSFGLRVPFLIEGALFLLLPLLVLGIPQAAARPASAPRPAER
ncbi:MAG: MFS transporter [Chloroflexi bacterium]|nr:MFS transporter [Chloroflexota bacterium]